MQCKRCKVKRSLLDTIGGDLTASEWLCQECQKKADEERREKYRQEQERIRRLTAESKAVILTTTPKVDGYFVAKYLGIESVEFVIGTGAFSEVATSIQDFFGARSSAFEKKLRDAKAHAMGALQFAAAEKGANAVLSVDLDYAEFSGNRIALIINGTLVKIEPNPRR